MSDERSGDHHQTKDGFPNNGDLGKGDPNTGDPDKGDPCKGDTGSGEEQLGTLLAALSPELRAGELVFCSFAGAAYGDHVALGPVAAMAEEEGLTLVIPRAKADAAKIAYAEVFRCISLGVHSSLTAVGLTAAFSAVLTQLGISANVIAGFHHDHIFVPAEHAVDALAALESLSL